LIFMLWRAAGFRANPNLANGRPFTVLEQMMFFAGGFLLASLLALVLMPVVHRRAVRLTNRRLEDSMPLTVNEALARTDGLRAEFAISTRRLERQVEQLRVSAVNRLSEIGRLRAELAQSGPRARHFHKVEGRPDAPEIEPIEPDPAKQVLSVDHMDRLNRRQHAHADRRLRDTLKASSKLEEKRAASVSFVSKNRSSSVGNS
jgi:hypothetical protein